MVQCDFSLLLDIHDKIQRLMGYLKIPLEVNQATSSEDSIVSKIISQLDKALEQLHSHEQTNSSEGEEDYSSMERQLQRQEQLNRNLIRRELEFKEYQKCVLDELTEEKKIVKGLQTQLLKANERALAKDLEILQLSKEKTNKDKKVKDYFAIDALITEKKLGDPFKSLKESAFTLHRRGHSDELAIRSSTTNMKKKTSIVRK